MFDTKKLPKNGAMARRLIEFANLNQVTVDPAIHDLASLDLVAEDVWNQWGLTKQEQGGAQYLLDWKMRGVMLDYGARSRVVAVAAAAVDNCYPILVLSPPEYMAEWRSLFWTLCPDVTVKYLRDSVRPEDEDVKVWIADPNHQVAQLEPTNPRTIIIDQLFKDVTSRYSRYNYNTSGYEDQRFGALIQDTERVVVLQGMATMFDNKVANLPALFHELRTSPSELKDLLERYFWKGLRFQDVLDTPRNNDLKNYLRERGYTVADITHLLHSLSVSTHLVQEHNTGYAHIVDRSFLPIRARGNDTPQVKQARREHEVEVAVGRSIAEIMEGVVGGDPDSVKLLDQLFTNYWCMQKANALRGLCHEYVRNEQKTIILADHPAWIRNLKLSFAVEDLRGSHQRAIMSRYLYPDGNWQDYTEMAKVAQLNFVIANIESLNEDLLRNTRILIMAEYPHSPEDFELVRSACEVFGIKMFCMTMANTWEEKLAALILPNEEKTFEYIEGFRSKK